MIIVHSDSIFQVEPGTAPDYNTKNPLLKLMHLIEKVELAAEREYYMMEHVQYLFPVKHLQLYSPSAPNHTLHDPTQQDIKTDFQKQNVRDFLTADTLLVRGWVNTGQWTTPFLRLSYRGGPDSALSRASNHQLGDQVKLWVRVSGTASPVLLTVPYNERRDCYEVELWGYPGGDLRDQLDAKGRAALDRGELQVRSDLIRGSLSDFDREGKDERYMVEVAPFSAMHPILPFHLEVAWADVNERFWDSQNGANYHFEFNMIVRGWENYLGVGMSPNPHGGIGFLEYRNLMSNYFRYAGRGDLGRDLEAWNFDAHGRKDHGNGTENFMSVDYMDLHLLKASSGIGLHRHRDNQEVFLVMRGQGLMVVGDWCKMPGRERCFEVRTLRAGHFAMLKGGNLHALMNARDEDMHLFMFGGYD
jgi:mannose-6-phosphate isomerase-like protein (cupin superfamily)